jgi:hypothetical protein
MDGFYASRKHTDVYKIQHWGRIDIEGGSVLIRRKILIIFNLIARYFQASS